MMNDQSSDLSSRNRVNSLLDQRLLDSQGFNPKNVNRPNQQQLAYEKRQRQQQTSQRGVTRSGTLENISKQLNGNLVIKPTDRDSRLTNANTNSCRNFASKYTGASKPFRARGFSRNSGVASIFSNNNINNQKFRSTNNKYKQFSNNNQGVKKFDSISEQIACDIRPNRVSSSSNCLNDRNEILASQKATASGKEYFADEIKKRLSLPSDTSIPESFLLKYSANDDLRNCKNLEALRNNKPLSRLARQQSLLEIGYGQLSTYLKLNVLGSGTYSTVYKGTSRLTSKLVALKEIHLETDEGVPFTAIREVSLLKDLKHINIITLHDIIYTKKTLTLVFEFVDRDLSKYMDECDHKINLNNVKLFLFQLLRGLKYCHDRQILHRDLKPQNILIALNGDLKLADFGLARAKSVPTKTFTDEVVTLWYRPPDVLLGNIDYGTSIDMWGVGCIFFEMVAGYTLFTGTNPRKQIECIFEIIGLPNDLEWPNIKLDLESCSIKELIYANFPGQDLKMMIPCLESSGIDLLKAFLKCNPRKRISALDALVHKYFSNLSPEIHSLPNWQSIFSIKTIKLAKEMNKHQTLLHNISV